MIFPRHLARGSITSPFRDKRVIDGSAAYFQIHIRCGRWQRHSRGHNQGRYHQKNCTPGERFFLFQPPFTGSRTDREWEF